MRHGSESFFIAGEGLITTEVGGREGVATDPVNVSETPSAGAPKLLAAHEAPPFRFSRVGPKGTPLGAAIIRKVARAMVEEGGGTGDIPAGYTYLGQFIDHDLTMDRTTVMLGDDVRPIDMLQGRSPRLDLDSLYGNGPGDAGSERFYAPDGLHLKTGTTIATGSGAHGAKAGHDLPRAGTGASKKAKRVALIADPRNDENLIVAQTHLAMIHFHNRVLDKLPAAVPDTQRFTRARKKVSLHYQWLIRHDYLPRICSSSVIDDVFTNGRKLVEPNASPDSVPTMPVEFSVAAFRLGHSMVRPTYNWNRDFPGTAGALEYMFSFSGLGGDLGAEIRLITQLGRRLPADVRLRRRRAPEPDARQQHQPRPAHRHADHRPTGAPATRTSSAARTPSRSTICGATSRSATSPGARWSSSPAASRWRRSSRDSGSPSRR